MNQLPIKIKELNGLCGKLHLDLVVKYYDECEVCFKGVDDNDNEIFNVCVWYPKRNNRTFYIELNSDKEEWCGGHFTKEEMLLLLSIDDLSDEELGIKKQGEVEE